MRRWFARMGERMARFMYGRYGTDALNHFLIVISAILLLLSCFRVIWYLAIPAMLILLWSYIRCFSRKIYKRRRENEIYLKAVRPFRDFFRLQKNKRRDRKTHCYVKCKHCKAVLRVPKGKGKIDITCPRCKKITVKRT